MALKELVKTHHSASFSLFKYSEDVQRDTMSSSAHVTQVAANIGAQRHLHPEEGGLHAQLFDLCLVATIEVHQPAAVVLRT